MEAAPNIFADNVRPIHTAHEFGNALRANLVHDTTHNDQTDCLDKPDYQEKELPFGYSSKLQHATTSLSTAFLLLAETVNEKNAIGFHLVCEKIYLT